MKSRWQLEAEDLRAQLVRLQAELNRANQQRSEQGRVIDTMDLRVKSIMAEKMIWQERAARYRNAVLLIDGIVRLSGLSGVVGSVFDSKD